MSIGLVVIVLAIMFGLLIHNKMNPALIFIGTILIFLFSGQITTEKMLVGFTNESLITLIILLLVSPVIEKTIFIPLISKKLFQTKRQGVALGRMGLFTVAFSAFLNNTAVVASLMGLVRKNPNFSPSKLLIPLSYFSIMGGIITLIGTSTNLVVNSLVQKSGLPGLGFFDFTPVGLAMAAIGLLYVIFILPKILPDNGKADAKADSKKYFVEVCVKADSPLIGKSIIDNKFRNLDNLFLIELVRKGNLISPVTPDELIEAGDILVFAGNLNQLGELANFEGIELLGEEISLLKDNLQEVVIRHGSPLIGKQIKQVNFRTRFDAAVVTVQRGDERIVGKLGLIQLMAGDVLLLAAGKEFYKHENLTKNFILLEKLEGEKTLSTTKSTVAIIGFVLAIVLNAMEVISLFKAIALLLLFFLALGYTSLKDLRLNFNIQLLLIIGSSLGISQVLFDSGVASLFSETIIQLFASGNSPHMALLGIYIGTAIVTEIVTNNAAAALMIPVSIAMAQQLGVDSKPFIMAVAYAASTSFITPIGYQTNLMVFGAGKYRFTDYVKGGFMLSLIFMLTAWYLIPKFFPFIPK